MRKILLFILTCGSLYACGEDKAVCETNKIKVEMQHSAALRTITFGTPDKTTDGQTTTRRSYNNRTTIGFGDMLEINSDIDLYDLTRPLGKVKNISLAYEDDETNLGSGYQINALYARVNLGDHVSLYHGAMPFKGGRFSEIKDPTINGGNGLAIINNQVYSSDFMSVHGDYSDIKYSLIAGRSEFNTKNHYNGLLTKNEGSSGAYLLTTAESGKHFFEADYYSMKNNMYDLEYAKLQIAGIGYIYDDSLESGLSLYTNLGVSNISEDVVGLMSSYGINTPAAINYMKSRGAVTKNTEDVKGYAGLFGANYEFDIGDQTYNIGVEEFITRGGWVSANHGVAFLSDHSWYANRNAIESTIYAGCNITKDLRISGKFVHTESQQVVNAFSISTNSDQATAFNGHTFYRRFEKIEFLVNYIF